MSDTLVKENAIQDVLDKLGIKPMNSGAAVGTHWFTTRGEEIKSYSPVDGAYIGSVTSATSAEYEAAIAKLQEAFKEWRMMPAPKRERLFVLSLIHI